MGSADSQQSKVGDNSSISKLLISIERIFILNLRRTIAKKKYLLLTKNQTMIIKKYSFLNK